MQSKDQMSVVECLQAIRMVNPAFAEPAGDQSDHAYRTEVARAAEGLPAQAWDQLSEQAQTWALGISRDLAMAPLIEWSQLRTISSRIWRKLVWVHAKAQETSVVPGGNVTAMT